MRKLILTLALYLFIAVAYPQSLRVSYSGVNTGLFAGDGDCLAGNKIIRHWKSSTNYSPVNQAGYEKERGEIHLIQFDSIRTVKESLLFGGEKKVGPLFSALKMVNHQLYVIYHETKEEKALGNVMAVRINPETLEAVDSPRVIAAIAATDLNIAYSAVTRRNIRFEFMTSVDGTKNMLLITADGKNYYVSALDDHMNVIWGQKLTSKPEGSYEYKSCCIDNAGKVYVAYKIYNKETESENAKSRIAVLDGSGKPRELILDMGGEATARHILLKPSKYNNTIHVAGVYLSSAEAERLTGCYQFSINTSDVKISKVEKVPFPDSLVRLIAEDGWGNTSSKEKKYGVDVSLRTVVFEREDGNISLVNEMHKVTLTDRASFDIKGDIVYCYFNKEQSFFSRIPKYRVGSNVVTFAESYRAYLYKDKMLIFYNDNPDNLKKPLSASPAASDVLNRTVLVGVVIDAHGGMDRRIVIDRQEERYVAMTDQMHDLLPEKLIVPMNTFGNARKKDAPVQFATISME